MDNNDPSYLERYRRSAIKLMNALDGMQEKIDQAVHNIHNIANNIQTQIDLSFVRVDNTANTMDQKIAGTVQELNDTIQHLKNENRKLENRIKEIQNRQNMLIRESEDRINKKFKKLDEQEEMLRQVISLYDQGRIELMKLIDNQDVIKILNDIRNKNE